MKSNIYALLIGLFLLSSCHSDTKTTDSDTTKTNPGNIETQKLLATYRPFIEGNWVKKDYIEKLIQTKSPLAAMDLATGITAMEINLADMKDDSLAVLCGYGNHDSGELYLKFKPGKAGGAIMLGNFDLKYSIKNGDTILVMDEYDDIKKTTSKVSFVKALRKYKDLGDGLEYLINKNLFTGTYLLTDSLKNTAKVNFSVTGDVSGWGDFTHYFVAFDLMEEPMSNLDEVFFHAPGKLHKNYTFKIKADTINLYDIYANADSTEEIVGKLKYKLVKQK